MMFAQSSVHHLVTGAALLALSACAAYPDAPGPVGPGAPTVSAAEAVSAPLVGVVAFPQTARVLATTPAAVQTASTVSLIDTATGKALASTLTDDLGAFTLAIPDGTKVVTGTVYVLEAVKGLNANLPGADAARVRTLVKYTAGAWTSLTGATLTLNATTTAQAIGGMLRKSADATVDLSTFLTTPTNYLTTEQSATLLTLVSSRLTGDRDPVAGITLTGGDFKFTTTPVAGLEAPFATVGRSAVGPFGLELAQTSGGAQLALATAVANPSSIVIGPYVYVIGGIVSNVVQRALINADGSIGPFTNYSNMATGQRELPALVRVGNRLYVLGGVGSGSTQNAAYADIAADGSLGTFQTATDANGVPVVVDSLGRHAPIGAKAIGGYVYLFGGYHDSNGVYDNPVRRAAIGSDGKLGQFVDVPGVTLKGATSYGRVEVIGSYVYLFGGTTAGTNGTTIVQRAAINADGTIGDFTNLSTAGIQLNQGRLVHASAVVGNYVYVLGGLANPNGSGPLYTVERARINADGTLDKFYTVSGMTLTSQYGSMTPFVVGDQLYLAGRVSGSTRIERISLNATANLGAFSATGGSLVSARTDFTGVTLGNYMYALGGSAASNLDSVERAIISPDGSLGAFASYANSLTTPRRRLATAVVQNLNNTGGYLYVLGGDTLSVERAAISADGSLGAFSTTSVPPLVNYHSFPCTAVVGNKLYVIGGFGSRIIEEATIGANGDLTGTGGNFTVNGAYQTTATNRTAPSSVVLGGYLYLIGGGDTNVERAPINANGLAGTFQTVAGVTMKEARDGVKLVVLGNYLYAIGGALGSSTVERAPIAADGSLGTFEYATSTLAATGRCYAQGGLAGDSIYIFGGWNGSVFSSIERAKLQ